MCRKSAANSDKTLNITDCKLLLLGLDTKLIIYQGSNQVILRSIATKLYYMLLI